MRILIIILIIVLSLLFNGCNQAVTGSEKNTVIVLNSDRAIEFIIEGFNNFESFVIKNVEIKSDSVIKISTDYQGFALLKFKTGQQYPLIISDSIIQINIHEPNIPLDYINSPENEFLYKCLLASRQNIESLTNPEYKYANIVLKARLLNVNTYTIKTIDQLNDKKKAYFKFINENYEILQHSDMLIQLAKQYFMMHEYVSYINEDSDLKQAKVLFQEYIILGVQDWINVLQNRIPATKVIEFCAKLYYDRSMVSQAARIFDYYRNDLNKCQSDSVDHNKYLFLDGIQFPDFEFVDVNRINKQSINQVNTKKIISIISDESICDQQSGIFSKVETIALARNLSDKGLNIPVIITPVEKLSEGHLVMDRMYTGQFYFMDDVEWQKKYLTGKISLPQFLLLDKNNMITKISNDRNEIIQAITD